ARRLSFRWIAAATAQEAVLECLARPAAAKPRRIGENRQQPERQEQQPPRRAAHRAMEQERRISRTPRDPPVHVVNREIAHAFPDRIASVRAWSSALSTSMPASWLLSRTALTSS